MANIQLLDFSDEIFLDIFRNFNDVDLLTMAQVSKRFKEIAKDTVAKKYNGDSDEKYCDIQVYSGSGAETQEIYCQFFETFGIQIKAIKIFPGGDQNNHLLKLINQHCHTAKYVEIWSTRNDWWNQAACQYEEIKIPITETIRGMFSLRCLSMDHMACKDFLWTEFSYPQLESLNLHFVNDMDAKFLSRFLISNPQLKHLQVRDQYKFRLSDIEELKNHFKELKSLEFICGTFKISHTLSDIIMKDLMSLKLRTDAISMANVLGAIGRGSKRIQSLEIILLKNGDDWNPQEFQNVISLFDELTSVKLTFVCFDVDINLLHALVRSLPKLTTLYLDSVNSEDVTAENILNAFRKGRNLKELKLVKEDFNNYRPLNIFDSDFHRKFASIVRNRGSGIKFIFKQQKDHLVKQKIIVTEDKIIKNGKVLYYAVYKAPPNQSNAHIFDLNDHVLEKIYSFLDGQSQRALYETCTKTKNALQEQIKSQWFTVSDEETARDIFNRFGEHVTKLKIDMKTRNPLQMAKTWTFIAEHYSKNLVEMSMNNVRVDATRSVPVEFPNLSKLIVKTVISSRTHIFPVINCPKLTAIEFNEDIITFPPKLTQFGITLTNLRTIRVNDNVNNTIGQFLERLDDQICGQIEEFTVIRGLKNQPKRLVHLLTRFQNLTTLNFMYFGQEKVYFKHLFKSCTKLKTITIRIHLYDTPKYFRGTVQAIKDNCKHLEVLKLYSVEWHSFDYYLPDVVASLPNVKLELISDEEKYLIGTDMRCPKPF